MTIASRTIAEYIAIDPDFSILLQALKKANLADLLDGEGNFTLFAPDNYAFNDLFEELGVSGIYDIKADTLIPILLYHMLGTEIKYSMFFSGNYTTLSPDLGNYRILNISVSDGVYINSDARVIYPDVDVKNGVIHIIDKVLVPPGK